MGLCKRSRPHEDARPPTPLCPLPCSSLLSARFPPREECPAPDHCRRFFLTQGEENIALRRAFAAHLPLGEAAKAPTPHTTIGSRTRRHLSRPVRTLPRNAIVSNRGLTFPCSAPCSASVCAQVSARMESSKPYAYSDRTSAARHTVGIARTCARPLQRRGATSPWPSRGIVNGGKGEVLAKGSWRCKSSAAGETEYRPGDASRDGVFGMTGEVRGRGRRCECERGKVGTDGGETWGLTLCARRVFSYPPCSLPLFPHVSPPLPHPTKVAAIEGYVHSISLRPGQSLQDTLRLLTLWFTHGSVPRGREARGGEKERRRPPYCSPILSVRKLCAAAREGWGDHSNTTGKQHLSLNPIFILPKPAPVGAARVVRGHTTSRTFAHLAQRQTMRTHTTEFRSTFMLVDIIDPREWPRRR